MDRDFLIDLFAGFRPGDDPPDVLRLRHFRRWHQFRARAARRALSARGRTDHSAVRGGGLKAVSVSNSGQDRHGQLVLAAARAAVRRSGGTDRLGEGGIGGGAARSLAQAPRKTKKASKPAKKNEQRQGGHPEGCCRQSSDQESRGEEGIGKNVLPEARITRVSKDGHRRNWASHDRDAQDALLALRRTAVRRPDLRSRRRIPGRLRRSTRLRPLRLAA